MKELIDFSSLNEAFGLPISGPQWYEVGEVEVIHEGVSGHPYPHTEETKKKISESRKGIVFTEEHKAKLSAAAKKRGDNCSPEVRKRISEARGKTYTLKNPEGIMVTFTNLNRFAREQGLSNTSLSRVVRGVRNSYRGWTRP